MGSDKLDEWKEQMLARPACEHPHCRSLATGLCRVVIGHFNSTQMAALQWCCDQHITGSDWRPIQETNWWSFYTELTGHEPTL